MSGKFSVICYQGGAKKGRWKAHKINGRNNKATLLGNQGSNSDKMTVVAIDFHSKST